MVNTCCVPGCTTGYKSQKSEIKIPLFKFPNDDELRKKWVRAIPRKNWRLHDCHRVCKKHFQEQDFITQSIDSFSKRRKAREFQHLKRLRLKPQAVPSTFHGLPKYLSANIPASRSTLASASSRLEKENVAMTELADEFFAKDSITSFSGLMEKLEDSVLPSNYTIVKLTNCVYFHCFEYSSKPSVAPKLLTSVMVSADLKIDVYILSGFISPKQYSHLLTSTSLQAVSQLMNILAWCKALADKSIFSDNKKEIMSLAVSLLESYCSDDPSTSQLDASQLKLLRFLVEQLNLLGTCKSSRRYSVNMLSTSFFWQLTSHSLYKKLKDFFILPSVRRLQQLSACHNIESGSICCTYLQQRISGLQPREKIVTLLIDEVYTAQRVEYCNGTFIGVTESGIPAKTVLSFMIQSTCGKYKDIVCILPISKLDTATLKTWFTKVMAALHDLVIVVAVSMDNHVCNRKLFVDLCGGQLTHSIEHPTRPDEKLFLLFDFTHNFKNIFNNFVKKDIFDIPTSGFQHILGVSCKPCFSDIKQLYSLEEEKPLKVAFGLKKVSLNPSNISKTSPQHALSIFHESTGRGLDFYAEDNPSFVETARFVKMVENLWKIMSVKHPFKGHQTRDDMHAPLRAVEDANWKYLQDMHHLFMQWKKSGNRGLTKETFTACTQTIGAIPELAAYLIKTHDFSYILPGKFLSDPIEGRFGWYRQVNGGNFFMSVKQLMEAEKKIRVLSLLQQEALLAGAKLSSLNFPAITTTKVASSVTWLVDFFRTVTLDDLSTSDINVAYYVAGYIGRSISCRRKCSDCKELLVAGQDDTLVDQSNEFCQLIALADRGGLSKPTELCFVVTSLAVQHYYAVLSEPEIKKRLFTVGNQRNTFVSALTASISESNHLADIVYVKCNTDHVNFKAIAETTFNCFAKNELKRFNDNQKDLNVKSSRKINKLTSRS